ncbi:hypothetical protein [Deinococcus yavapaiensis]|uniref:Uncharacterized protein n=1 Tax=Deinococcus yavapaiensis KR-236 TaxID=694435 RepID=A0A318S6R3_9DEIO|nr:hypothetical protein [Deinococcus yavapaiensis]PYE53903.1 hypothetical protein DES52_107161 [Deinococcus yavapaiensis KR-236]
MNPSFATVIAAALIASMADAQNDCDGDLSDFDAVYCSQKLAVQADKNLNAVYRKLVTALTVSARGT